MSRKAGNFFPEFNIRLYDKNSESDYFVFSSTKIRIFFQQHWESEYLFRKKNHNPLLSLEVKWSVPNTWHLEALNFICHSDAQFTNLSRSFCNWLQSSVQSIPRYKRLSSANKRYLGLMSSPMSFMYSRNIKGPKTVPWGTPDFTWDFPDVSPSTATHCIQSMNGILSWYTCSKDY